MINSDLKLFLDTIAHKAFPEIQKWQLVEKNDKHVCFKKTDGFQNWSLDFIYEPDPLTFDSFITMAFSAVSVKNEQLCKSVSLRMDTYYLENNQSIFEKFRHKIAFVSNELKKLIEEKI